jgi:hypothetical protein
VVLPLGVAAAAAMSIAVCLQDPWRSLLVNLAATFLGSIVTVFFIDKILRRNEEQRWERVKGQVGRQVTILANSFTSSVRTALKIRPPDSWMDPNLSNDPARMREAMIELIEHDVLPAISGLQRMDQAAWRSFAANLSGGMLHCDRLISLFGSNLDPQITGLILDLHQRAGAVLSPYQISLTCSAFLLNNSNPIDAANLGYP